MSAEPVELLANKIMDRYNKHPVGWAVLKDFKGNVLVKGPKEGYMLKIIMINPQEYTGIGVKIDSPRELRTLVDGSPAFGYRPLTNMQAEELLNSFRHRERQNRLISEILERKPVPTLEIEKKRKEKTKRGVKWAYHSSPRSQHDLEEPKRTGVKTKNRSRKTLQTKIPA